VNDDRQPTVRPRQATVREFIAVVFRRKWIILGLFLVTTTTILAISLTTATRYVSIGRVLIKRGERESALASSRRISDWKEDLASEMEIMKSVPVANRAQAILDERVSGGGHKVAFRSNQIDVQVLGQSNVVQIAYLDPDASVAHEACDALIAAYVEQRLRTAAVGYPKAFFDSEISSVTQDLNRWETQRRNFISGAGISDFDSQREHMIAFQMTQTLKRDELATELAQAQSEQKLMQEMMGDPTVDFPLLSRGSGDENLLVEMKNRVLVQEAKVATLRERFRDDAPEVVNALVTLETMRAMLRREVEGRLRLVESRVTMLEQRMGPITAELKSVEKKLASMPAQEKTINEMDREISVLKTRYSDLMENADRARITQETSSNVSVTILAPASPAVPSNARDYVRLALAPAFSLVVGLGLAFFLDGLDSRVRTPHDVETSLDVPVLASITERRRGS